MDTCLFCNNADMILGNRLAWAKYDKYPVSPGHMLIISKRHVPDFFATTAEERFAGAAPYSCQINHSLTGNVNLTF